MRNRLKFIVPLIVGGMILSGCNSSGSANQVPFSYSEEDLTIDTPWVDYAVPASSISFEDSELSLSLEKGEKHPYQPRISPKDASNVSLSWETSDDTVATITNKGELEAVGGGNAVITVSSPENLFDAVDLAVEVTVKLKDLATDVTATIELDYGQEYSLLDHITLTPADTTQKELNYSVADDSIISLENGVVTALEKEGSTKVTVTSSHLENKQLEFNFHVADRTVYASSVQITGDAKVEVGKDIQLAAEVLPANVTHPGYSWSLANKEDVNTLLATIDENGKLSGVDAGKVIVTATSTDGRAYADHEVEVFEVKATSINLGTASINLSNADKNYQINATYVTDTAGYDVPSVQDLTYTSADSSIATVNASGFVTAVGNGDTTITVSSARYLVSATLNVHVEFLATSVTLTTSSSSVYVGGQITVTANVSPNNASVTGYTFTVTGPASKEQNNNVVTLTATDVGTITVKATENHSGVESNLITITVNEPEFENAVYLVGSANFSSGISTDEGGSSWKSPRRALAFGDAVRVLTNDNNEPVGKEYKVSVKFRANDQWLIRTGPNDEKDFKKPTDAHGTYEEAGALQDGAMEVDYPDGNILVKEAGKYDIYFKLYDDTEDGWFSVYIGHADFRMEPTSLRIGENETATLKISNWEGNTKPEVVSSNTAAVTITSVADDGTISIASHAEGNAVVTATDSANNEVKCNVEVKASITGVMKAIYLNANGQFDDGDVSMFAHSWNSEVGPTSHVNTKITYKALMSDESEQDIVYTVDVPAEHDKVVFTRGPKEAAELDWATIYNQSENITLDDEHNMWTMTGYEGVDSDNRSLAVGQTALYNAGHKYTVRVAAGYGLKFSDDSVVVGTHLDEQDYQGRDQYLLKDVHFTKDLSFKLHNFENGAEWIEPLDTASMGGNYANYVQVEGDHYLVLKTFVADVYLKLKWEDNQVYIAPASSEEGAEPNPFDADKYYVVGSVDYSSGVSTGDASSWNDVAKALVMTLNNDGKDDDVENQYKATITFRENDEWRVRSANYPATTVENAGALSKSQMEMSGDNVKVNNAGKYDIYFKVLKNNAGYSIYVGEKFDLKVDKNSVAVAVGEDVVVKASNWAGAALAAESADTTIATVVAEQNGTVTIHGVATGTTKVTVSDGIKSIEVSVEVSAEPIPTTKEIVVDLAGSDANGGWGKDNPAIFAWVWKGSETGTWVKLENGKLTVAIDADHLILLRMEGGSTSANWDTCWNRTGNIEIQNGKVLTFSSWNGGENGYSAFIWVAA